MILRFLFLAAFSAAAFAAGPVLHNLELVGQLPLGPGFNAGVWVHGNYAYVGTWGSGSSCPATGVKVVDLSDPSEPKPAGRLAAHPNTTAENVVVRHVENAFFQGDLLAVGLQSCAHSQPAQRGVELFDVTDPRNPKPLSFFDTGKESHGVHELDLVARSDGRVLVLLATIARFRLLEATDPASPRQVSDWNLSERLNEPLSSSKFCHSALASLDGTMAFLSYWDAGVILLDIRDPANPNFLGRTGFEAEEQRNANSVSVSADKRLMLRADENLNPGDKRSGFNDWGFLRVFDISEPSLPRQLSTFLAPHAHTDPVIGPPDSGAYTIHSALLAGELGFLSWYSDGLRVVDLADRRAPVEVGSFVPPGVPDPFEVFPAKAEVWGVAVQAEKNLVLASDVNYGLYVLRPLEPNPSRGGVVNAASFAEGEPVAPGSMVSLPGSQLAGSTAAASSLPLPTQLAGAVVKVNGVAAPLYYASPAQINFLIPEETRLEAARITVENLGRPGREILVNVAEAAPGLFTLSQDGRGTAAARRASDQTPVDSASPAHAGEIIELFASGLGTGAARASVRIGGRQAEVLYSGPAPGFPGLYQLNVRVPQGARGNPEVVVTAAERISNSATLPVE